MHEVFLHPEHSELFLAAARGDADWDAIYDGYTATVDWPGAAFWRELAAAYPEAKVLLTVRDPTGLVRELLRDGVARRSSTAGSAPGTTWCAK